MEKADEGGDQDEKTKIAGTKKSKKAEKIQQAEEKKRKHSITTEKIDEAKTKRRKEAERQNKVEDRSALKGGPIHQEVKGLRRRGCTQKGGRQGIHVHMAGATIYTHTFSAFWL